MTPRRCAIAALVASMVWLGCSPVIAAQAADDPPPVDVYTLGGNGTAGAGAAVDGGGGGGGGRPTAASGGNGGGTCFGVYCSPLIDDFAHLACWTGLGDWCPDDAPPPTGPAPIEVAQMALDSVDFAIPAPQLSPPARQITGLRTWFWMDPDHWRPVTATAQVPGLSATVTVTPTTATWHPGDGGPPVTCHGPGRPHPGTDDARTDCGHTYTVHGDHTLTVEVTYTVTWTSSTGAGGTLTAVTLTTDRPVHVEQRQAVTD